MARAYGVRSPRWCQEAARARRRDAEQLGELAGGDRQADADLQPDEHDLRHPLDQEAEADQAAGEQRHADHQGQGGCRCNQVVRACTPVAASAAAVKATMVDVVLMLMRRPPPSRAYMSIGIMHV